MNLFRLLGIPPRPSIDFFGPGVVPQYLRNLRYEIEMEVQQIKYAGGNGQQFIPLLIPVRPHPMDALLRNAHIPFSRVHICRDAIIRVVKTRGILTP